MSGDWHGLSGGAMRHWRAGERPCDACLTEKRRASKAATLDRERGNPRTVELGDAAHAIIAATPRLQLAEATGLMVHKLSRLHAAGPGQRVHRRTRDRILAAGGQKFWTPIGIQRRLRALQAIGWSARAVAAEMGTEETTLRNLIRREHPQFVRRAYAERILAAYDVLSATPRGGRGAARARNAAAANGWAPPSAWDDIDDPHEDPFAEGDTEWLDPVLLERILDGDYDLLEHVPAGDAARAEVCRRWWGSGRSLNDLERRTGWNVPRYFKIRDQAVSA